MVDALASDRSDQPFGEAVLPRRAWGDGLVADAHGAQSVRDGSAIDAIPIADHVARRLSPRECFGDLACDPVRGTGPWRRCPARGYAGRCTIPGMAGGLSFQALTWRRCWQSARRIACALGAAGRARMLRLESVGRPPNAGGRH